MARSGSFSTFLRTVNEPAARGANDRLTPQEREVLGLVAEGLTNHEIAQRLALPPSAVARIIDHVHGELAHRRAESQHDASDA